MTRFISLLIPAIKILLLALFCYNCDSEKSENITPDFTPNITVELSKENLESVPGWYTEIPEKEGFRHHVGIAKNKNEQIAAQYAEHYAYNNLTE